MYNDKSDIVRVKAENVASMIKPGKCDGILAAPNAENKAAIPPDLTFDKVVQQIAINEQREKDMQSLTGIILRTVEQSMALSAFEPCKEKKPDCIWKDGKKCYYPDQCPYESDRKCFKPEETRG